MSTQCQFLQYFQAAIPFTFSFVRLLDKQNILRLTRLKFCKSEKPLILWSAAKNIWQINALKKQFYSEQNLKDDNELAQKLLM